MRTITFALLIGFAALFNACTTQSTSELYRLEMPDIEVQEYSALLKKDTYTFETLPQFSPVDINYLLDFTTDDTELENYPISPISSYKGEKIMLGYLALWTIENIRLNYPYDADNENQFLFPSKHPSLRAVQGAYRPIEDLETLIEAAAKYQKWWEKYDGENFDEIRAVDPLANSGLAWF